MQLRGYFFPPSAQRNSGIEGHAPADAGDAVEQQVDPAATAAAGRRIAITPQIQTTRKTRIAEHGDESAGARPHGQRLLRNRKKATSARAEAASDQTTQPHSSIVLTPKTRMARNQPQTAPTPDTSEVGEQAAAAGQQVGDPGQGEGAQNGDGDVGVLQRALS